jgi:hypothetical protein
MQKIRIVLFALCLGACSSGSKQESSVDASPGDSDTATTAPAEVPTLTTGLVVTGDTSQLNGRFDEISEAIASGSDTYYTVSVTTRQYEASSEVTWYFDDTFLPRYFKMSWAAEGNEGSTEYFIEQNEVVCATEEENNQSKKWCASTGGIATTWNESDDSSTTALLEADFATTCNDQLEQYMSTLTALLKEGEITAQDENSYTIRIEKTMDVGTEVTESTEVNIPRKLYASIIEE